MKTQVLYEERSGWAWWVHLLFGLTLLAAIIPGLGFLKGNVGNGPEQMPFSVFVLCLALGTGIPAAIYALMGQLRIRVDAEGITVAWGYLEVIKKRILFESVESAEAVSYSPLREFGGWGIRFGANGKKAWTVRGRRALLLGLKGGTQFYIGSDRPERILQWVTSKLKRDQE